MNPPTISRTECVSFPRSGHHLLEQILREYFGTEFRYCEVYTQPELQLGIHAATNFQKNHDLDLETPVRSDRRYLVQVRYPLDSIVSLFSLDVKAKKIEDSPAAWIRFAFPTVSYWMRFYRKWVLDPIPGRAVVNYDTLIAAPVDEVASVVRFLTDGEPDLGRIASICDGVGVERKNSYRTFRYYGAQFFSLLKGLFAAVPGVDIENDRLIVPGSAIGQDDPLKDVAIGLRRLGVELGVLSADLDNARAASFTQI